MADISGISAAASQSAQSHFNRTEQAIPDRSPAIRGEQSTISPLDVQGSQRLLASQIVSSLNQTLENQGFEPVQRLNPQDFTPEAVANQVIGFVEAAIGDAESPEQRSDLLAQARQGVERGVSEASDILTSLNALSGPISDNVDRTENLLIAGLDRLQNSPAPRPQNQSESLNPVSTQENSQITTQQQQSISIEAHTQGGDVLSIQVQRQLGATVSVFEQSQGEESNSRLSISRFSLSDFAFSIEGNLDPGEAVAVQDLVTSVQDLANDFFSGNLDRVLAGVPGLEFDGEQISAFSLNLSQSVTVQQTYEVNQTSNADLRSGLQRAGEFLNNFAQTGQQAAETTTFEQPERVVQDLFASLVRLDDRFQNVPQAQQQNIDSLVEQLYS